MPAENIKTACTGHATAGRLFYAPRGPEAPNVSAPISGIITLQLPHQAERQGNSRGAQLRKPPENGDVAAVSSCHDDNMVGVLLSGLAGKNNFPRRALPHRHKQLQPQSE
jgi:hypothetical protein